MLRAAPSASTRDALRTSTLDGVFAVQYITLTGGTLLTTFLLTLGATAGQIGLVASLPLLAALLQPLGAEVVRRRGGRRKGVALGAAAIDVGLWGVTIGAAALLPPASAVPIVIGVLALQQAATAFVGAAWTSWISDLVPARLRGRYFGSRNLIINALGTVTAVGAGLVLRGREGEGEALSAFLVLIALGVACRLVSLLFLGRQPEPRPAASPGGGLVVQIQRALKHGAFRRYLTFQAAWSFAVNLASPFFTVYMLGEAGVGADLALAFAALGTASNLVGQRVWGPLCDRYGDHQVVRVSGAWAAAQPLFWLFTDASAAGIALIGVLTATGGFAWAGLTLATGNLTMRLAPEAGKTSFFAAQAAVGGGAGAFGALTGGVLAGSAAFGLVGLSSFKVLFVLSAMARLSAWLLLRRVPVPATTRRLRAVLVLRDTVRTLNPAQGFSPLLHAVLPERRRSLAARRRRHRRPEPA
jgi:MFS family permease